MDDKEHILKANNMVHSRVNEITRKYGYVIEGFSHIYRTHYDAVNDALEFLKCKTEKEGIEFLYNKYKDNVLETDGKKKAVTLGDAFGMARELCKTARHVNIMHLISIGAGGDDDTVYSVKRFTHKYDKEEDAYSDASVWYDMEDKQKADEWLLGKYEDNGIDEEGYGLEHVLNYQMRIQKLL